MIMRTAHTSYAHVGVFMSVSLQKASFWKRISAFMFDAIVTIMLTMGFATVINVFSGYGQKASDLDAYYAQYEQTYGVDFDISQEDFSKLTAEQQALYTDANKALQSDVGFQEAYQAIFRLTLLMYGGGALLAFLVWYFVIPLFFGYGRTMGKKIFGIAVIRTNCVKVSTPVLFIRTVIGMYAIETMMPLALLIMIWFNMMGIVGLITIGLLGILQIGVLITTHTNSSIHDLLTDTVVVEFMSQQIFDTQEDLMHFVQEEHAKEVENAEYDRFQK
jgi:uncharacterized RDD family membrane protein YckC